MIRKDKSLYLHTFRQPRYVTTLVIVQPVITWGDSMRTRTRLRRRFTSLPGPRLTLMPSDSVKWVYSSGSIHSIYLIFINVYIIFFIEKKKFHNVYRPRDLENFVNLLTSYCCKRQKCWILLKLCNNFECWCDSDNIHNFNFVCD